MKKWDQKQIVTYIVLFSLLSGVVGLSLILNYATQTRTSINSRANDPDISLEGYCQDGYYQIPGEPKCSRAPYCGGYGYDELNTTEKMPNPQTCMGDGADPDRNGCAGYVPLCCYEMARTGNYTKCIGYWERLWCSKFQCDQAVQRGASNSQCGGDCGDCGHAFKSYCGGNKPHVPLAQRLGLTPPPNTPTTPPIPTATNTQTPATPTPTYQQNQPTATATPSPTTIPGQLTNTPAPQATNSISPATPAISYFFPPTYTLVPSTPSQPIENNPQITHAPPPTMDWETPKEVVRDVLTYQRIEELNEKTEKPLAAVEKGYVTVIQYDRHLENIVETWILRVRREIIQFIQKLK